MASSNYEESVPEEVRDEVFRELKTINNNHVCIDCEKKNPKWASIHLGIHLCLDCAGKHRQYGVMYSFVKSNNFDVWNRKQLLFMQKGGNQRALDYLTKCGVLSETHKHIDYKSPIVQKYKAMLTSEVQTQIFGKPTASLTQATVKKVEKHEESKQQNAAFKAPTQIPVAESVQNEEKGKKKNKKKIGKKIDLEDFDNLILDDGVPIEEKQKIAKSFEKKEEVTVETSSERPEVEGFREEKAEQSKPAVEQAKQMSQEQIKQKLEQLKAKPNVNSISSDSFKDTSISPDALKQNLDKFSGAQSISSAAFFGGQDTTMEESQLQKIKGIVTDTGGKIFSKLSSYWTKN